MAIVQDNSIASPQPFTEAIRTLKSWQWVRYGIAGVLSAAVDLGIFYMLATWVLPCIDSEMGDDVRAFRFVINKTAAFLIANGFSYWLNARFVFTSGRHSRLAEFCLFFGISSLSYFVGAQLGRWLISDFATSTQLAAVACIATATVMNFAFRKLLVFKG